MFNYQHNLRLGLYEKALPNTLCWEEKLNATRELGFDFLEISVDESEERRQRLDWSDNEIYALGNLCQKYELPLQSMCLSAHRKFPFGSADPVIRAEAEIIMKKAITLAFKLGIRTIQLAGYDVYYEEATPESHQRFIQGMQWSARIAERAGVMLAVEIMDTPYLNSLSKFEVLKQSVPSPYFMAYPDIGNINGWGYDVCKELQLSQSHLVQIHLKDTLKVSDNSKGQFRDLVIGEGDVDFESIFSLLKKIDYHAPLVIEMWAQDDNWRDNIEIALERILAAANRAGFNIRE